MPKIAKYTLNKFIVLWTVLLLFTPCTTKQSIKDFLGLPVATLYSAEQANKLRSCPETRTDAGKQATANTSEKQLKNLLPGYHLAFPATYKETLPAKLRGISKRQQAYTVPIYLLHEQLLI